MGILEKIRQHRNWFPIPKYRFHPKFIRWVLLEGNRLAVTGMLVTVVYASILYSGIIWTFEMQRILTETSTVETILDTYVSGMILLVSIVVSINSIALSQDITSVNTEQNRADATMEFRRNLGSLAEGGSTPSNPSNFMSLISEAIIEQTEKVVKSANGRDEEYEQDVREFITALTDDLEPLLEIQLDGSQYSNLWKAMQFDSGAHLDRSYQIQNIYHETVTEADEKQFQELIETIQLFSIGRDYFKSLYYTRETAQLSRLLLVAALPSVIITSTAILAINAQLFPTIIVLGLPPLQLFVATVFTIALIPYLILTAYMLRLSTVAKDPGGLFRL
jgi:hypothetical protein